MNGLALCAGVGGLELGVKLAFSGYRCVCYVEGEVYAAACLVQRMQDGYLDEAPVWSNLKTFDGSEWRGKVDIITAGFPCQPFSVAGKGRGKKDSHYLWPSIAKIIEACGPEYVFLENVQIEAFREPYRDLQAMGFKVSDPFACTAAELGAGHLRRRIFILAYYSSIELRQVPSARMESVRYRAAFAPDVEHRTRNEPRRCGRAGGSSAPKLRLLGWWASEPALERVVYGVPHRVDRSRALGNAVVPSMAAFAFSELMDQVKK